MFVFLLILLNCPHFFLQQVSSLKANTKMQFLQAVYGRMEYSGSCSLSNRALQVYTCIGTLQLQELPSVTGCETNSIVTRVGGKLRTTSTVNHEHI